MKPIEILNKIYSYKVRELVLFLEDYDIEQFEDMELFDEGIQDSKVSEVFSLLELAKIATTVSLSNKLPYPRVYKKMLETVDKSVLTKELFEEYYNTNKQKAALILAAAMEVTKILKAYDELVNSIIQEKPSTN